MDGEERVGEGAGEGEKKRVVKKAPRNNKKKRTTADVGNEKRRRSGKVGKKKKGELNMMGNKYIMITTTFDNKEEANKIIEILLEKSLVSCCQLSNIESSYHWKGKIEHTNEFLLQMKSKKELFTEIEQVVLKEHTYETPQLVAYDIVDGFKEYLDWIGEETK